MEWVKSQCKQCLILSSKVKNGYFNLYSEHSGTSKIKWENGELNTLIRLLMSDPVFNGEKRL